MKSVIVQNGITWKRAFLIMLWCFALIACGGGGGGGASPGATYTIGLTLTGLTSGALELQNNSGDDLVLTTNGVARFSNPIAANASYAVTIKRAPAGQVCSVNNSTGVGVTANITNVQVVCGSAAGGLAVGGTLTGLANGQAVALINLTNSDTVTINSTGDASKGFTFPMTIPTAGSYNVQVKTQPDGGTFCSVYAGVGTGVTANVTNINVVCSSNAYTVGGTVSGLLPDQQVTLYNNGADAVIVTANTAFAFPSPVANQGRYLATIDQSPAAQTCTVNNPIGIVTGTISNIEVVCAAVAYTVGGAVSGLTTGSLTLVNNSNPENALTISANSGFTFESVAEGARYNVTVSTNPPQQACTVTNGTGVMGAAAVTNVGVNCFSTAGKYVYVTNNSLNGTVSMFSIGANGILAPLSPPTVSTEPSPQEGIAIHPAGTFLYVANNNAVSMYSIAADGVLAPLSPRTVHTGIGLHSIAINPAGTYMYVSSGTDNTVSMYAIGADGVLTLLSTPTVLAGNRPYGIAIDTTGTYAYVTNFDSNSISMYSIQANGVLAPLSPPTFSTGIISPFDITVDPAGTFVYVTNVDDNSVSVFGINNNGTLTSLGALVATGSGPQFIAINPLGTFAYVVNARDNTVSMYSITNGQLSPLSPAIVNTEVNPLSIAIDPAGTFAYVTNRSSGTISMYAINSDGTLTALGATPAGNQPFGIAITR